MRCFLLLIYSNFVVNNTIYSSILTTMQHENDKHEKQWDLDIGILHFRIAYAIMPAGKKKRRIHVERQQKTHECTPRGFFYSYFLGMGRINPIGRLPIILS